MKILLYTDSRGLNISGADFASYPEKLAQLHDVDMHLRPFPKTTTLDFVELYERIDPSCYDIIVLHTGIVEFAPRRKKSCLALYKERQKIYDTVFGKKTMERHLRQDFGYPYKGDRAINMYSLAMAEQHLLPLLKKIPNLIWISINRDTPAYNNGENRPPNIHIIEEYAKLFMSSLGSYVDLLKWNYEEVRDNTFDSIHFTEQGSDYVLRQLVACIEKMQGGQTEGSPGMP